MTKRGDRRVGVITPAKFPGKTGDTANYLEIVSQLVSEGFATWLICPKMSDKNGENAAQISTLGFRIARIPYEPPRLGQVRAGIKVRHYLRMLLFLLIEWFTVFSVINRNKIRSVYMRHSLLTMHIPFLLKLCRVRITADGELISDSIQGIQQGKLLLRILRYYERKMLMLYDYYKVSTKHQVEALESMGFPGDRILFIPMSINIDKVPKFPIEAIPENTFGYFGALEPWQGPDLLVTSFGLLLKQIPQAKLYIIGDGSMKKTIEEQILRDRFSNNIILVNSIPREVIWNEYFGKFRILVIPRPRMNNSIDSLPSIKLIEALAAGKVVIATDIPSMREVPSDSILLVPPGDALSLAKAMESMSLDNVRLEEYSRAALTSANNHDIKVNIKKLIRVMENHKG